MVNCITGANRGDAHYRNVNPGRDFPLQVVTDLRLVREEDPCPQCGRPLLAARGIEVGQVFKLGTKYSEVMGLTYLDEHGTERPVVMGCYGIGVTRTLAAAVEQNHDEQGIIWPAAIAPFAVVVVPVNVRDEVQSALAEKAYTALSEAGVEVLLDDRPERPGVKFKDADLVGYPLRVTVGKTAVDGLVELRLRKNGDTRLVGIGELVDTVRGFL